jgi:hypothetical protein
LFFSAAKKDRMSSPRHFLWSEWRLNITRAERN